MNVATNSYQMVPVTCPNCQYRFQAPVLTIIDTARSPQAKALFLSGQLNFAACPQCGHAGMLSVPLVYHDPRRELLFTFIPAGLGTSDLEQQKIVGDLTNRLISSLPTEQRKGYLFRPRSFLGLEAMVQAILEADGISSEMLEAQRARASLLAMLLRTPGDEARQALVLENDAKIDLPFLQLLETDLDLAEAAGQEDALQELLELREQLLQWSTQGKELALQEEAIRSLGPEVSREGLLEKVVEAALADQQAKVETMVAVARPAIDYVFYQGLSERIETAENAGNREESGKLKALRETILNLTEEIDAELRQATDEAEQFLNEVLASDDPQAALRADADRVDDLFLNVLRASLEAAERSGALEKTERLRRLNDLILDMLQEGQPPQVRLINRLMAAPFPEGTLALLQEHQQELDQRLLEIMAAIGKDLTNQGRPDIAQRLAEIRDQAKALVA